MNLGFAAAVATLLAILSRNLGWLTGAGTAAAIGVGTAVLWGGGAEAALLLATFVATSSLLSRRAGPRNARQVTANGACAAAGALMILLIPETGWAVLAGGLAAATADTWATEIGVRSRATPRLLTSGELVARGTSGGVTLLGTAGGIAGASLMGAVTAALSLPARTSLGAWIGGVAGMFADSLLGATMQGKYRCETCAADTERPVHACGQRARLTRGHRWLDNDGVNLAATCVGAAVTLAWVGLW